MLHSAASNTHHTYLKYDACFDICFTQVCVTCSVCLTASVAWFQICHVHDTRACWLVAYLQQRVICSFVVQEPPREQAQQVGPVQQLSHFALFLCDAFAARSGGPCKTRNDYT